MPRVEIPGPPISYAKVPTTGGPGSENQNPIESQLDCPTISDELLASINDPFAEMPQGEEGVA